MASGMNWDRIHRQRPSASPMKGERGHEEPRIANSVLQVTLGQRLAARCGPMPNIKGDRPPDPWEDEDAAADSAEPPRSALGGSSRRPTERTEDGDD